jgi:drug/metabolite transporter (DMT)-like permease
MMSLMGAVNLLGQYLFVRAIASAPPSVLAPFSYSQIVWSTLIGLVVFGTLPDGWTFLGAGIVSASGLYVWHRERVRHREALAARAQAA